MSALIHVIYASTACEPFDDASLAALLRGARDNNAQLGITGMLLFSDGDFIQVLEGEEPAVDALVRRIFADPRHGRIVRIIRESIAARSFADWSMGFVRTTRAELASLDGHNDFFGAAGCFRGLDDGRAKRLLAAFGSGRWRSRGDRGQRAAEHRPVAPAHAVDAA